MKKIDIISQIKAIENEQKNRYKNNAIFRYNNGDKVHKKQLAFHQNQSKLRWVFGGNRSGKTECGAVETIYFARGIHPYRENRDNVFGWVVSLSLQVQRDVAQGKILNYLNRDWIVDIKMISGQKGSPENGVIDYILIKNAFGGTSKIGFKSCDQGREKFQGTSLDFVWFDEEPPYDIFQECRMRLLDKGGVMFGTMTPLKGLTWVYHEIFLNEKNQPSIWHEFMEWADNPFLSQSEIDLLTASLSPDELECRRYGKFTFTGGQVYSEFDESIHVIEPFNVPREWFDNISIDPGLKNPLSAHWYAVDYDGNVFVIAEHFESEKTVEYHSEKIKQICENLDWPKTANGMISALIDSASNQKTLSSEKSVAELFYDNGILVNTKVNKDLFSGISRVKSYLKNANGETKLFIFKTCINLIREIKSYWWGDCDVPIKKDDHSLDEMRYYIMSRPEAPRPIVTKTPIQKHKEKMMSKLKFSSFRN